MEKMENPWESTVSWDILWSPFLGLPRRSHPSLIDVPHFAASCQPTLYIICMRYYMILSYCLSYTELYIYVHITIYIYVCKYNYIIISSQRPASASAKKSKVQPDGPARLSRSPEIPVGNHGKILGKYGKILGKYEKSSIDGNLNGNTIYKFKWVTLSATFDYQKAMRWDTVHFWQKFTKKEMRMR